MRSASDHGSTARIALAVALGGTAVALTGCATTQERAARLRLNADRIRASQTSTRVTASRSRLIVTGLAVVAAGRRAAFAVTVHNPTRAAVSDLPISVGYRRGQRRTYLNADSDGAYFAAHLPAIAAGHSLTWVYAAARAVPHGARPFALVGGRSAVPHSVRSHPPRIEVAARPGRPGAPLVATVRNLSSIPQYQLPIYAVARRGRRTVAAGTTTVAELGGGARRTVRLRLLGRHAIRDVRLQAPATILQ